jgi:hypothetical protein
MKTIIHKLIFIIACFFACQAALGQQGIPDTADGLKVSAVAWLRTVGDPKLQVVVHLLNTTNHDITVLTKTGHSRYFNLSSDKTKFMFWFWFDTAGTWEGHLVAPSLPELAPVTIKPNEVAFCFMDVEQNDTAKTLQGLTKDSPMVISYKVMPELGARFGCWSGRIDTKPFHLQ